MGHVDSQYKVEKHTTEFEKLLKRLGLDLATCMDNAEVIAWVKANRNTKYIPEQVMHKLRVKTRYDDNLAPYSLTASGVVIPEPKPLVETEVCDVTET